MKTNKSVLENGLAKITPGKWWVDSNNEIISMPSQVKIGRVYPISEFDNGKANAYLIAAAPEMVEDLKTAYIEIQTAVQKEINNGRLYLAIQTDSLRASLRNRIASLTEQSCEDLQNEVEAIAFKKAKGKD